MNRREFSAALALAGWTSGALAQTTRKGRLKQCVTGAVFNRNTPFEEQCRMAAEAGCVGFDLVQTRDWPTLKKFGLIPTMSSPELMTARRADVRTSSRFRGIATACRTSRARTTASRF
jgi:hypothetical protein